MNETVGGLLFGVPILLIGVFGLLFLDRVVAFFRRAQRRMSGEGKFADKQVSRINRTSQGIAFVGAIALGGYICITALLQ